MRNPKTPPPKTSRPAAKRKTKVATSGQTPLFAPLGKRAAGVFCHLTSLPGPWGIGTLGECAHQFVDFLRDAGQSLWQVCPLGPTGYGDSPYQSFSSRAGNPYLIDWNALLKLGHVSEQEVAPLRFTHPAQVDYGAWYQKFWPLWHTAANRFLQSPGTLEKAFQKFCQDEAGWLDSYSYFSALKDRFKGDPWYQWPTKFRKGASVTESLLSPDDRNLADSYRVAQFFFFRQWEELRSHARSAGIRLVGDVPIYVSPDSADVWSEPEWFAQRADGSASEVAGVPPDYFTPAGQLWGNPLYDWKHLAATDYQWWHDRLAHNFRWFDTVRLDHFRGFAAYWAVPATAASAVEGQWRKGPGLQLLKTWVKDFDDEKLIAEDLGLITSGVNELLQASGLPRMAVLQFAFDGDPNNLYLPHNLLPNMVVYTGTHDNDTSLGWYQSTSPEQQDLLRRYLRVSGEDAGWDLVRAAYGSVARWAIVPLQDLLGLGEGARFNTPGEAVGNWSWRCTESQLEACARESGPYLAELVGLYGRTTSS